MGLDVEKLKAKGWTDYEIHNAMKAVEKAKGEPTYALLDDNMYWLLMLVGVLGNLAFCIWMLPAIIILPHTIGFIMTAITGLVFGMVFSMLAKTMEWLQLKHHIIYSLVIPFSGFLSFALVIRQANYAFRSLGLIEPRNPFLLGVIYLVFFLTPYIISLKGEKRAWKLESGQ